MHVCTMTRSGLAVEDISEEFCEVFMHPSVGISSYVFLKRMTLVGFVKVTFFARLSTPS